MGALDQIRVLDLTRVLAGPWCAQTLADFGADVIKIERRGEGDDTRQWGPPYFKTPDGTATREAAYYLAANRNKRSVTVDIGTPEGQRIVRDLAAQSDVVLENYKVGQLRKYGLDYASLKAINPALIYCSITGFGQDGPYAQRAGYDFIVQGMGGFMSVTGEPDADGGGDGPQKAGVAIADLMTGMYATTAVLAALAHRDRTGEGQYIDRPRTARRAGGDAGKRRRQLPDRWHSPQAMGQCPREYRAVPIVQGERRLDHRGGRQR
ncbi:Formyl-CoA:oxalate CoA-transferase [Cupriavidus yeoncheonensis]|uniref:Formyl-CoA:oxalate CoA-transferase n=1 Tax=Cupriavidus yeoncheonensis TaxID=1462994 RepID=A0A916IZI6_9BURK|nr:Formyl-CoA:oxalate CoA-transferase [Cupriavidus yeoncheonensis]